MITQTNKRICSRLGYVPFHQRTFVVTSSSSTLRKVVDLLSMLHICFYHHCSLMLHISQLSSLRFDAAHLQLPTSRTMLYFLSFSSYRRSLRFDAAHLQLPTLRTMLYFLSFSSYRRCASMPHICSFPRCARCCTFKVSLSSQMVFTISFSDFTDGLHQFRYRAAAVAAAVSSSLHSSHSKSQLQLVFEWPAIFLIAPTAPPMHGSD